MLNKTEKSPLTHAHAAKKYNEARHNLLLVIILSVVNIVLYLTGSEMMMLFSATIPYFSVIFGHVWSQELEAPAFFVIGLCIAFVVLALYLACWLLAKKAAVG